MATHALAAASDRTGIVTAALALLDEQGLEHCTLARLADRLDLDEPAIATHFADQTALFVAMGEVMTSRAVAAVRHAARDQHNGWRAQLRLRGRALHQAMLSHRDGSALFAQLPSRPPMDAAVHDDVTDLCAADFSLTEARTAMQLVDRFTLGWSIAEQARRSGHDPIGNFDDQLDVLLGGIAAARGGGAALSQKERHRVFQGDLWVLLRNARESANIAFSRTSHINELDRRILLLLKAQGELTLAAISAANGVDKAQVSRAIKRLGEVDLLVREGIRTPLRLSNSGKHLADRLMRLAELRNRELAFGIADDQLLDLFGVLDILLDRSVVLFERERKFAIGANRPDNVFDFQDIVAEGQPGNDGIRVDRSRILPPFITLCSYVMRGGALAYKRETGLSNFDAWVLAEVCQDPPISWPQLVIALYRDQSQAGRTVKRLIEIGLIERSGKPGRRHGFFSPTSEGQRLCDIIRGLAEQRSAFLFQGIAPEQASNFFAAFDILVHNSEVQLARERALQEIDRD